MKFTGTQKVHCVFTYCFDPEGEFDLTLEELEKYAEKNILDEETSKIIREFSKR